MTPRELRRRIAAGEHVHDLETLADSQDPQPGYPWLLPIVLAVLVAMACYGLYRATLSNASLASEQVASAACLNH